MAKTKEQIQDEQARVHQQWYADTLHAQENNLRLDFQETQWGITATLYIDPKYTIKPMDLVTSDHAGGFHWLKQRSRKETTYRVRPLNVHPQAQEWEVTIHCRDVSKQVTVSSRMPGQHRAENVASVHNNSLAFACAHEHIRRMAHHVLRQWGEEA